MAENSVQDSFYENEMPKVDKPIDSMWFFFNSSQQWKESWIPENNLE